MRDDHYVAQTYLKHFAGPSGMLRAYRKSDGRSFPCWPKDICHEPDGDIIPDFLSEPAYLGEFRGAFEPLWNHAVEALKARSLDMRDKLHIAGYWANLMICTPTWKRVAVEISNQRVLHIVKAHNVLSSEIGKPDQKVKEAIEAAERGEIIIETEGDYVRAQSARSVLTHAWGIYNADWDVFENDTGVEYVTSDNPASFEDLGDTWGPPGSVPFVRYLPVTPRLCLMCDLTRNPQLIREMKPDFQQEPRGTIRGGFVGLKTVERINVCTVKCAEDLVLCSAESQYVRDLASAYSRFRVENESAKFRRGTGFIIASRTRVIERKDRPSDEG
jgi:Protein of unknown function (DUF4238)